MKELNIWNEDGYFFERIQNTLTHLRATKDMLTDMYTEMVQTEKDPEVVGTSKQELMDLEEVINYWELVLKDNNQPIE